MAAYIGGGSGSGDTHVSGVMGNKPVKGEGRKKMAAKKGSGKGGSMLPTSGGTPGKATKAAKSAGTGVGKSTSAGSGAGGSSAMKASKTGSRVTKAAQQPSTAKSRRAGNAKQGGASFPQNS